MCRHLGYVGPPVGVGELVMRGPHSLFAQSWAPADMRAGGTINADGFGVAWWRRPWRRTARDAGRYRNPAPIWTDPLSPKSLAGQLESRSVIAAVRSATVGMPVTCASACAPFTDEHWAFSHNGAVPGGDLAAVLADIRSIAADSAPAAVHADPVLEAESFTDSAALGASARPSRDRARRRGRRPPH